MAVANSQVLANLVPSNRRNGWPNTQVLAYLLPEIFPEASFHRAGQFAAEKSLPAKMPEVIADARPHREIDPTVVVVSPFRMHMGQLFHPAARKNGNRDGQIGKCLPI